MPIAMRVAGRCAFCGAPAQTETLLLCGGVLRAELATCYACAASLALHQWRLAIGRGGRLHTVDGRSLEPEENDTTPPE